MKGFDVPQLTKNYYNVVSFLRSTNVCLYRRVLWHGEGRPYVCDIYGLSFRWYKTSLSMSESLWRSCSQCWPATCALYRPATSKQKICYLHIHYIHIIATCAAFLSFEDFWVSAHSECSHCAGYPVRTAAAYVGTWRKYSLSIRDSAWPWRNAPSNCILLVIINVQ